ncbi:TetR/AcrR family transcriptional regulator [Mycolicibacterium flavescens]|uniref:TetR/AcrR family transcriptional regulator n=1 Tax=Mycolicibacterium flavescens TaxID=1776 RepID=UPI000A0763F8|nr:TetR/AcrR family transcriptional regulator [Mycolicibacterium flavescens]MCV7280769.1 TetR/AcrR family transcriptional regulator [Mycolicibacterium flavescens]
MLLEAAAQVFNREGLAATTNRIAERAGVSIGSLYQYFPNKHALIHALAERHVNVARTRIEAVFKRLREEEPPFEETMRALLDAVVALHQDRPGLHRLMHRLGPRTAGDIAAMESFEDDMSSEVAWHLARCGRDGDDAESTARTVVHAVDTHLHRVMTGQEMDVDQLMTLVDRLAPPS